MRLVHLVPLLLISSMGFYFLNTNTINIVEDNPAVKTNQKAKDFDFYSQLPDAEVAISSSNYTSTPKTESLEHKTTLQIATVSSESGAQRIAKQLREAGLADLRVRSAAQNKANLYQVVSGPYTTYIELKTAISLVEKKNFYPLTLTSQD